MYTPNGISDRNVSIGELKMARDPGSISYEDELQVWEWNQTSTKAIGTFVHDLITARVLAQPASEAVCSWEGCLTYSELEELSSRLAGYLAGQGIGPEILVPLCFEKSIWTIVAMLAVLKAGGAFVPLDPTQPKERLIHIIGQTEATLVLSSSKYAQACGDILDNVFVVDAESMGKLENNTVFSKAPSPNTAAYVIFTSGSTGQPKGVIIEHEQLSTSSILVGKAMGFESKPRVLQFASYVFDACILEILTTLVFGGCICVPSDSQRLNNLVDVMNNMRVTCAFFTPSLLSNLRSEVFETLDTIILGGESIPPALVTLWASRLRLILAYGPTECCVICFTLDTSQCTAGAGDIGRAISGQAWIVQAHNFNELAPTGTVGELIIEGPILARGYLNDKAKTDAAFIHDPKWMPRQKRQGGSRMYRTGDLVKYNEDGSLNFVGRIDNQVKVRGQRLELGEVEFHLRDSILAFADIREVVVEVVIPTGEAGSPILAAFLRVANAVDSFGYLEWAENEASLLITSKAERQRLASLVKDIRTKLLLVLPAYAVPSLYIPMRHIPLSVSGKVDRQRLRCISAELSLSQLSSFSEEGNGLAFPQQDVPQTPLERQLQDLWAEVLEISHDMVVLKSNFFWLGGDSVRAIGLVTAARKLGLLLTVETVFRYPVLSEMALQTTHNTFPEAQKLEIIPFALIDHSDVANRLRDEASVQCKISREQVQDIYPTSPMQQGLMALSIKEVSTYVMQLVYSLPLSMNLDYFKVAWQTIAAFNPILRTRFFEDISGDMFQAVLKEPLQWQVIQNQSLDSYLAEDKKSGLQMGQPMSRYTVLEDAAFSEHQFVWTIHHSLIDGWSLPLIIRAVEQCYLGYPASSTLSFNHFIRYLSYKNTETFKEFWRHQLIDAPSPYFPQLPSPTYRPLGNASLKHEVTLSRQAQTSITTATIIKAAWSLLVGIYSNTTDVVTGMTLSGRTAELPGIELVAGPTIATIPFRVQFQSNQSVNSFLESVQRQYLDIIPYEQIGLQNIKRISAEAEASCSFRSLLIIQSTQTLASKQAAPQLLSMKREISIFLDYALTIECELEDKIIKIRATFDKKVLNPAQIRRIFRQFDNLLHRLGAEDPNTTISDVQGACQADVTEIMEWNLASPVPFDACVHELIEQRIQTQPDHLAVCAWDGELSYKVLGDLSSCLAAWLINHENIGPESLVPICFVKSKWAVIAMLGVLKAGGACVPLDLKHPIGRQKTILENLGKKGASVVLTSMSVASLFEGIKPTLIVDSSLLDKLSMNSQFIVSRAVPRNPAFVVFTSGSTGKPKGIIVEHVALCTSAREHGAVIKLGPHSRVLQFAAFTFDISYSDIFATLIHGGSVCIPSEHDRMNDLVGAIRSMDVNQACLTPTVASQLRPEDVRSLNVLVVAGEPSTKELVERWADHVVLINMYGPAECTIYCVGKPDILRSDHPSDIGHGVGALTWIVNPGNSNILTPIGGLGELLIEGPTLARSYLNDEIQTSAVFIENPAWVRLKPSIDNLPSRRLYKTGDLVQYNPDGSIRFVGRKNDGQVKLRGQRIELGEVEYQLRASLVHPLDLAVVVFTPDQGRPTLAAFLTIEGVSNGASDPEVIASSPAQIEHLQSLTAGLEKRLSATLPSYMVPSVFIPVFMIPHTSSGKVNRKKLRQIADGLSLNQLADFRNVRAKRISPSTFMEQRMHDHWTSLLKLTEIGINDNFFQLGGDSITAMRLVAAAHKDGVSLTVDKIFKNPVLSDMALVAHRGSSEDTPEIAPFSLLMTPAKEEILNAAVSQCKVGRDRIEDIYPCTPQQEFWIKGGIATHEHQAQSVYYLPASLNLSRFCAAWEAVVASHAMLRTRIIHTSNEYLQVVVKTGIEWRQETSLASYLDRDRCEVIGLGESLQRFCIVEDDSLEAKYFVWTAQHASYDGWSLYLLFQDLDHAYQHGVSKASGVKFNQFIKTAITCDKNAASAFWQTQLAGPAPKPLFVVPEHHQIFPDTMWKRRIRLSMTQRSQITISTMIEVSWSLVFAQTLGCHHVVLDILRAGRTTPIHGLENLIAPTTTAVPFRIHVDHHQRTQDLLLRVQ